MGKTKVAEEFKKVVTSLESLQEYAKGNIVELPPFSDGQEFYARVRRPSMLKMIKTGKIPNQLLTKANELFLEQGSGFNPKEESVVKDLFDILEGIASEALVEPSYDELKSAGIELTDDQLMFLFQYSQKGVQALESFRTE